MANRESLAKLLAAADVVIAPGPAETFGLSALEALASGTPVVVSSRSALPEVVGQAGLAADDNDVRARRAAAAGYPTSCVHQRVDTRWRVRLRSFSSRQGIWHSA